MQSFKKITDEQKIIGIFLTKAIVIFVIWNLVYLKYAEPRRTFDKPLTDFTVTGTKIVLNTIHRHSEINSNEIYYPEKKAFKTDIIIDKRKIIGIADPCNALELIILYIAFFFCYPLKNIKKLLSYIIIGTLIIYLINVARVVVIAELNWNFHYELSSLAHHYLFKIIVYALVFFMWVKYVKVEKNEAKT